MSQSETWDALCLAAEWRAIGRETEAERVMPDPDVKHVWRASAIRAICHITEPEGWDPDEAPPPKHEQVRDEIARLREVEWMAWIGTPATRSAWRGIEQSRVDPVRWWSERDTFQREYLGVFQPLPGYRR